MSTARAEPLVNGRYLTRPPTGVDRFANEVLAEMARKQAPESIGIAVPANAELHDASLKGLCDMKAVGRRRGHAWEQLELSKAAGERALVNLCNTAPLLRGRQLVVIHDAATVDNAANYSASFRNWYRLMHGSVMRRADVVATVSKFSADQLTKHYGRRRRGIEVIPESGEHILRTPADEAVIDRLALRGRRYVLAVGSNSANKNFRAVLQAITALDDPDLLLVAAGGRNARVFSGATLADERLRMTGYVSDAELRALYEHAACFAFPSFYEGFGLPPLEAMCCGCPVIVSDRASLPEVCGDAALYCKAEDPATLAQALRELLSSAERRSELREAGLAHTRSFSWRKASEHLEQVLHAKFR